MPIHHALLRFLFPALAYYVAGQFGLLLAIPPGFASAVWPAAGVALTFALLRPGLLTLAGIGVGSFVLNLHVVSGLTDLTLQAAMTPALIGTGALLQAAAGAGLYRMLLKGARVPDTPRTIGRFVLLVGPISCLIAASIGAGTLLGRGIISLDNLPFTWGTWWVGDTIGIVTFTPMLQALLAPGSQLSRRRKLQSLVPPTVLFICITLLFGLSTRLQHQRISGEIEAQGSELMAQLEQRLARPSEQLAAYRALFLSQESINWQEFQQFSALIVQKNQAVHAVGWTPPVNDTRRNDFELTTQAEGIEGFRITELDPAGQPVPASRRPTYYPVQYIYPVEENSAAFGFDLGSRPDRLNALLDARETRRAKATAPLKLVQEQGAHLGMILYLPVFKGDYLVGFVSGVFRLHNLVTPLQQRAAARGFGVRLHDVTDTANPVVLVNSKRNPLAEFNSLKREFDIGGRILDATIYADTSYLLANKDWASWSILTFGFTVVALIQALLLLLTGTTQRIEREVASKTRELARAKEAAEIANQAKTDFLANMSHELRTPLNTVTGLINRCLKTPLQPEQQDLLSTATMAADTLVNLINQTLDYSKIGAGKLTLERAPFSPEQLIKKIASIFSLQAEEKQLAFTLDIPEPLPHRIIGDALRLEQVLLNLCSNALKFTHRGEVRLQARLTEHQGVPHLILQVSDTGIGISEETQQQLFQAFSQADSSTTRQYGGTGLGLAISKSLMDLMGGTIAIDSAPDQGTTLSVQLPVEIVETKAPSAPEPKPAGDILSGQHLLLVEDIAINREIVQYLLEDYGARITCAGNGRIALEKLAEHHDIDLVLMDIQMPEMDGYQATAEIRNNPRTAHLPIIAMTANAVVSDIEACRAAGMNEHVGKPIDEMDLVRKIVAQLQLTSVQPG